MFNYLDEKDDYGFIHDDKNLKHNKSTFCQQNKNTSSNHNKSSMGHHQTSTISVTKRKKSIPITSNKISLTNSCIK